MQNKKQLAQWLKQKERRAIPIVLLFIVAYANSFCPTSNSELVFWGKRTNQAFECEKGETQIWLNSIFFGILWFMNDLYKKLWFMSDNRLCKNLKGVHKSSMQENKW